MSQCKVLEKCKKCKCCQQENDGLANQINLPRPTERVIERQIVELATRCEECGCTCKDSDNADQRS